MHSIKRARKRRGLTMQAAASRAGVQTSTVYRIEHHKVKPHKSTLKRLNKALRKK